MAPKGHSIIGASQAKVWMNCPGMPLFKKSLPSRPPSRPMSLGTAAHALGEAVLNSIGERAHDYLGESFEADGRVFVVTPEMADAVQQYVREVRDAVRPGSVMFVEQGFSLPWIHPELHGTNDAAVGVPGIRLDVYDYKNGSGSPVSAHRNPQLMIYALGAMGRSNGMRYKTVGMHIVQPNMDEGRLPMGQRSFEMDAEELLAWGRDVLTPAAAACFEPSPVFRCGSWCDDCSCCDVCPQRSREALEEAAIGMPDIVVPQVEALPMERLVRIYESKDVILGYLKAVEARIWAEAEAKSGAVPYKVVQQTEGSLRRWTPGAEKAVEAILGNAAYSEPELLSPAKIESALREAGYKKAEAQAILEPLVTKSLKEPKLTLVSTSDKRKAIGASDGMPELV